MRNPKWHRDEIILTLNLYFQLDSGKMNANSPEVIEISELLNNLPIHRVRSDSQKFRNPNGVALKLGNFKYFDSDYKGIGLKGGSKLDKEVFDEFCVDRQKLQQIAKKIKLSVQSNAVRSALYDLSEEQDDCLVVKEGAVIYKLHKLRERNPEINKRKKAQYLKKFGKLDCEVCGVDFYVRYGQIGKGYIEAHHKVPLSQLEVSADTTMADLALVCSNCHRMLHRGINDLSVESLKNLLNTERKSH
jgi:5-methylcytosine-specific restriction protein A